MCADDDAGGTEIVPVVLDVDRCHRHDRHHDELAENKDSSTADYRRRPGAAALPGGEVRTGGCVACRRLRAVSLWRRHGRKGPGQLQRIRPQHRPQQQASRAERDAGQQERTGKNRDPDGFCHAPGDSHQIRPDDGADGGRDQHGAHRAATPRRRRQIGAGVSSLQTGGYAGTVDEQRGEEQDDIVQPGCRHDAEATHGADQIAGAESDTTAGPLAQPTHANRGKCSARREQRTGQAGPPG